MRFLVLGAGMMGSAVVYDLVGCGKEVVVCDIELEKAKKVAKKYACNWEKVDAESFEEVSKLMKGADAVISALPYRFNYKLAKSALKAKVNFCDMGGNIDIVNKELSLDKEAKKKNITIVPDCGLAPGIASILTALGVEKLGGAEEIHIRVGGLPKNPKPPLNYELVFSVEGLINEYIEKAVIIKNWKIVEVESMTGLEEIVFEPFGKFEAFYTSGGTSTLPMTYKGKVKELDYKTIRYPGHCEKFKAMLELGLASEIPIELNGMKIKPRNLFQKLLSKSLKGNGKDFVLLRVEVFGCDEKIIYEIADSFDEKTGLTAMARTTAFPVSIIAQFLANGKIEEKGVVPQEICVPKELFVSEIRRRGIKIEGKTYKQKN
ncbi:MAG: saccharopine dehydrogenase C-terminal domain-containing protein [Candidatus Thermoplasmatota archaeon]